MYSDTLSVKYMIFPQYQKKGQFSQFICKILYKTYPNVRSFQCVSWSCGLDSYSSGCGLALWAAKGKVTACS